MPTPSPWTDEKIERLKALIAEGLSCSRIAGELGGGITRNSVIGKIHRLGIAPPKNAGGQQGNASAQRRPRQRTTRYPGKSGPQIDAAVNDPLPVKRAAIRDLEPEPVENPIALADLEAHHCRWPVQGAGASILFCGANRVCDALSYCARHSRMAYQTAAERRHNKEERERDRQQMARAVNSSRIATSTEWA